MAFDVTFTDGLPCATLKPRGHASGVIVIGEFKETISTALDVLSKQDYMHQWRQAAQRIVQGRDRSAIITSFADRGGVIVGMWWPLYVCEAGLVAIQNQMISREVIDPRFSIHTCYDYVGLRETMNEEGETISEWVTTVDELAAFAKRIDKRLSECGN